MSIERGVLDTSAVIRLGEVDPERLPVEAVITTITLAELTVGPLVATSEAERAARQQHLQQAEADFGDPLPFDDSAARAFGQVAAALRQAGRKPKARAFDAMIAAIAVSEGLPLFTFNARDFDTTGVETVDLNAEPDQPGAAS
ncbi:MAG: type II toxin-antitoxin system VapC family toxin [Nocardioides sp.]|uniref:type II toxin-antitoxin system VapC family toxin n=1 Tax=Nocardioides sp. TaxID=35761 RepID=UPI0039E3BD55